MGKFLHDRAVKSHQTGLFMDGQQKGGDITITHKNLRVLSKNVIIDPIQDPEGPVSAPSTEYGLHTVVSEHGMDVFETGVILSCQISPLIKDMR